MPFRVSSLLLLIMLQLSSCSLDSNAVKITQQELLELINSGEKMLLIDVRTTGEYRKGFIANATHIDHREINLRMNEINNYRESPVVVYCLSGIRAAMVESTLIEAGFKQVLHLKGDWSAWQEASLPVTRPEIRKTTTASTHP